MQLYNWDYKYYLIQYFVLHGLNASGNIGQHILMIPVV